MPPSRRRVLALCVSLSGITSGCRGRTGTDGSSSTTDPSDPTPTGTRTPSRTDTETSPDSATEPDVTTDTETTTDPGSATETQPDPSSEVTVRWSRALGETRTSQPAIAEDIVIFGTQAGSLVAFDRASGTRRWHRDTGGDFYHGPTATSDVVYGLDEHTLYALDPVDGTSRWSHEWEGHFAGSPVVGQDRVYVANSDLPGTHTESEYPEDLFALSRDDGTELWRRDLGRDELSGTPILADGTLYAQVWETGTVHAIDPANGTTRWQTTLGRANGHLAMGDGLVFGSGDDSLYALDPETGEQVWRYDGTRTAPVTSGGTVVVGTETGPSRVIGLTIADGTDQWTLELAGDISSWTSLSTGGDTVYVSTHDTDETGDDRGTLSAIAPATGTVQWRYTSTCRGYSRTQTADGVTYLGQVLGDARAIALAPS